MFGSLRFTAMLCLLLALGVFAGAGYLLYQHTQTSLHAETRTQHVALVQSLAASVWRSHSPASGTPAAMAAFSAASQQFLAPHAPLKLTVFSPDVRLLYYGSTPAYVAQGTHTVTLFDVPKIQQGQVVSRLLHGARLTSDAAGAPPRILIQTVVPIMQASVTPAMQAACNQETKPHCVPEALVEIYTDITPAWNAALKQYTLLGIAMGSLVLFLLAVLWLNAWRAEHVIAKQHDLAQHLTEIAATAEARSRDKSEFLANISHELRTPLNAIIGFSEILKTEAKPQLTKNLHAYTDDIYASGVHLLSLINDILDFSKAEAGKLQISWDDQDLGKILRATMRLVIPRAEAGQITLMEDFPAEPVVVHTDAKKLKQVLLNLLSNAVKFTPAGGEVRCSMWLLPQQHSVAIEVRDSGIGIDAKDIPKVLAPFGQVDSELSRKFEGTGLGLPLAKKLVEVMGGNLVLESEVGVGTVVRIILPLRGLQGGASSTAEAA